MSPLSSDELLDVAGVSVATTDTGVSVSVATREAGGSGPLPGTRRVGIFLFLCALYVRGYA